MNRVLAIWVVLVLPAIVSGWIVVALLAPFHKKRPDWIVFNGIYGNDIDTIHGDTLWRADMGTGAWATWLWSAWRNPVHNLLRYFGVAGRLEAIDVVGKLTGGKARVRAKVRGKWHVMYWQSGRFMGKYYQLMAGPKIWPTKIVLGREINTAAGDHISAPLAVRILPWVSAQTAGWRKND